MMSWLARQDGYDPNAFDVPGEQSTNVGWANRMGEILTARPTYDEQTVLHSTASPLVNITEGDIGRATEAAMGVSGGGMKVETPKGIRAYHSSPHDFDKFDLAKIGTGEGAQVYGHGLYFAENPAVSGQGGQYYKAFEDRFLRENKNPIEGRAFDYLKNIGNYDRPEAIKFLDETLAERLKRNLHEKDPVGHQNLVAARELLASGGKVGPRTYEVNINADPAHMLDWDKPLAEMSPAVKAALSEAKLAHPEWHGKDTGEQLYRAAQRQRDAGRTSAMLNEAGIPGIKYLDQGSRITSPVAERILEKAGSRAEALKIAEERLRTAGMGDLSYWDSMVKQFQPETSNYVIFDPNLIRIDKKYAVPGAIGAGGMGALAAQNQYEEVY